MKAIVVVPTQGFGNRLRMIASTYILAKYMKLEHYIIWKSSKDCNIEFDEIWKEHPFHIINEDIVMKSVYVNFGHVHTNNVMGKILNPGGNVKYIVLTGGHEFLHPAMSSSEFLHDKYKLYSQLIFHCEDKMIELPKIYGCVHIRSVSAIDSPDITKSSKCNFNINSPTSEFIHLMRVVDDDLPLVIISNNMFIAKIFQDHFPTKRIIVNHTTICDRSKNDCMHQSILDFVTLTKSQFIIGSYYSSFSDEASFFNIIPKVIPLSTNLLTECVYHCSNFTVKNKVGYLNFNTNTLIKYFDDHNVL